MTTGIASAIGPAGAQAERINWMSDTYLVFVRVSASYAIYVEAEDEEDAKNHVLNLDFQEIKKHGIFGETIEDVTAEPVNIVAEPDMRTERAKAAPEFDSHPEHQFNHDWDEKRAFFDEMRADMDED